MGLREPGHTVTCLDPADRVAGVTPRPGCWPAGVGSAPPSLEALAGLAARSLAAGHPAGDHRRGLRLHRAARRAGRGWHGAGASIWPASGIPAAGILASALAMDKHLTKVLRAAGVATANWIMAPAPGSGTVDPDEVGRHLDWPVVVKPSKQGAVGLSIVREPAELQPAILEAFRYDDEVMIERFVPGQELTVRILGDPVLPTIEIKPVKELYDYECKYTPGMAEEFVAELPADIQAKLADQASGGFTALKLRGYARIDFRLDPTASRGVWKANTLPGMTPCSLIPQAAAAAGVLFPDL